MSLLSYTELMGLLDSGVIVGAAPSQVNPASIDVRLGPDFLFEKQPFAPRKYVSISERQSPMFSKRTVAFGSATFLEPGEFCLAGTMELFNLPDDISAEFKLKSSAARCGLNQMTAVWADAGWNGSILTLELKNDLRYHSLELEVGMAIGQMVFHRHAQVPAHASYRERGRYNGDTKVQCSKP